MQILLQVPYSWWEIFNIKGTNLNFTCINTIEISFPVSTILTNVYPLWMVGRPADEPFFISVIIHYPEETISYKPGFWQIMKWAWMQYLSVLAISVWVFRIVKSFVFQNQLVTSMKNTPWKKDYWLLDKTF